MRPPSRKTRTTDNPGAVDLPKSRRKSSEVAVEKEKKKEKAAASAIKKCEQAARVARVEREIEVAQMEAGPSKKASRVKRAFPRIMSLDKSDQNEVSAFPFSRLAPGFS